MEAEDRIRELRELMEVYFTSKVPMNFTLEEVDRIVQDYEQLIAKRTNKSLVGLFTYIKEWIRS